MIKESNYQSFLSALLEGNRSECMAVVQELLNNEVDLQILYTDLFQSSLYRIGELWEQNKISVAVEHLATAITENLIATVYPSILSCHEPIGKKAVISCSANEYHQVGARMVTDIMELYGWQTWFLGANTPAEDLLNLIQEKNPDVLGLSLSVYFNMCRLKETLNTVHSHYPHLDVLVGGQAFRWGGLEIMKSYDKVNYIPSLADLTKTIQEEQH